MSAMSKIEFDLRLVIMSPRTSFGTFPGGIDTGSPGFL